MDHLKIVGMFDTLERKSLGCCYNDIALTVIHEWVREELSAKGITDSDVIMQAYKEKIKQKRKSGVWELMQDEDGCQWIRMHNIDHTT